MLNKSSHFVVLLKLDLDVTLVSTTDHCGC